MKLTNMIMIISGLMILFWLAGLNTSVGYVLGQLGVTEDPTGIVGSDLYNTIFTILSTAAVAGVVIGLFAKFPIENLLIIPIVLVFLTFLGDLLAIISITNASCDRITSSCAWITWVVTAVIVPIGIVFLMSIVDWWRGRD